MRYYPAFLDLREREVLVVGGGKVAERKVKTLLEVGARVRVVSLDLTPALAEMAALGQIAYRAGEFEDADLEGVWLVIGATNDPRANQRVAEAAARHRLFCNIVDVPALCSFLVPALIERGDVLIAISTSGQSPALAQRLKREIEMMIGPEYGRLAELLGRLRAFVKQKIPDAERRADIFHRLVQSDLPERLRAENPSNVERHARQLIERWIEEESHQKEVNEYE